MWLKLFDVLEFFHSSTNVLWILYLKQSGPTS